MWYSIAFLLLVVAFQSIGNGDARHVHYDPGLQIINGTKAVVNSLPSMMFLYMTLPDGNRSICGGTLLSENYVLTAAHCVDGVVEVRVYGGRYDLRTIKNATIRIADSWYVHEKFSKAYYDNDIAIIKLSAPMEESDSVGYAKLPTQSEAGSSYVGSTVRTYGWGKTEDNTDYNSDFLLYVDVDVMSNSECADRLLKSPDGPLRLPDLDMCTSKSAHKGTCNGDSGGPLLSDDGVQIGITSFGAPECEIDFPDIFVKVGNYLQWIEEHTSS